MRFLFYSILTLSLSLRFFTCDFSSSPPAILPYSNSIFPLFPFLLLFIFLIRILCFLFDFFLHQSSFPDFIASSSRFYSFPVPIFTSLSSSPRLRFLFYSILTLSLSLRFFTCDSFSPPAISFTYCRLKQSPCPKFLQHSSVFTLSTPRFNLSIRFIFYPFERSFALKNLENAKNSPKIMQFDNPNSRQNPMILCFTT